MKKYICRFPGCAALLDKSGYCNKHRIEKPAPFQNAVKSNKELYSTMQWNKLRAKLLEEQSSCFKCGSIDNLHVHHIIPPRGDKELFFDTNNLVVICSKCHRIITNKEIRQRK
jgi:5-methylcytosine-specific restriction protein A